MNYTPHPDYEALPKVVQSAITPKEYAWLPDAERNRLIEDLTLPEVAED